MYHARAPEHTHARRWTGASLAFSCAAVCSGSVHFRKRIVQYSLVHYHVRLQLFLCWYPCFLHSRRPRNIFAGRIVVPSSCTTATATDHIDKVMEKEEREEEEEDEAKCVSICKSCMWQATTQHGGVYGVRQLCGGHADSRQQCRYSLFKRSSQARAIFLKK